MKSGPDCSDPWGGLGGFKHAPSRAGVGSRVPLALIVSSVKPCWLRAPVASKHAVHGCEHVSDLRGGGTPPCLPWGPQSQSRGPELQHGRVTTRLDDMATATIGLLHHVQGNAPWQFKGASAATPRAAYDGSDRRLGTQAAALTVRTGRSADRQQQAGRQKQEGGLQLEGGGAVASGRGYLGGTYGTGNKSGLNRDSNPELLPP